MAPNYMIWAIVATVVGTIIIIIIIIINIIHKCLAARAPAKISYKQTSQPPASAQDADTPGTQAAITQL